jgi:hypothetical protein
VKRLSFKITVLGILFIMNACRHEINNSNSLVNFTTSTVNGLVTNTVTIKNDTISVLIKYAGVIELSEDEAAIKSISPNGYLKYNTKKAEVIAESNANGIITYFMRDGNRKFNSQDAEARKFLASALRNMHSYGFELNNRIEALYRKGGTGALLNEVGNMRTDDLKAAYFEFMLRTNTLTTEETTDIAGKIGTLMNNDHFKGELFIRYADHFLKVQPAITAYFTQVRAIVTPHNKSGILKEVVKRPLSTEAFLLAIDAAVTVEADMDKSAILMEAVKRPMGDGFMRVIDAVDAIRSDMDKANVLKEIVNNGSKTSEQWIALINSVGKISFNKEKTDLMVQIGRTALQNEAVKKACIGVIKTITTASDYERAMKAISW